MNISNEKILAFGKILGFTDWFEVNKFLSFNKTLYVSSKTTAKFIKEEDRAVDELNKAYLR